MNKTALMKSKKLFFLMFSLLVFSLFVLSFELVSSGGIPAKYNFEDYKFEEYNNAFIGAEKVSHCSWKPDNVDDGFKECNQEVILWNRRGNNINIGLLKANFDFSLTRNTRSSFTLNYSVDYEIYDEQRFNVSSEKWYTVSRIKFTNWKSFDRKNRAAPHGSIIGIKVGYEIPKYSKASYNMTYSPLNFLLDPDVSACGTLDTANGIYTLTQDISTTGDCLEISADNITVDGAGFTISGDGGAADAGVDINSVVNATIKNLNITNFGVGINVNLGGSGNNLIQNNSIFTTTHGISVAVGSNIITTNTITSASSNGIILSTLVASIDNNVTHNIILTAGDGISIKATFDNTYVFNNTITSSTGNGLYLETGADNNIYVNNTIESPGTNGISFFGGADFNTFTGGSINNSGADAIDLGNSLSNDNNFTNIVITNTDVSSFDAEIDGDSTYFIDMPYIGNYSIGGNIVIFKDTNFGEIKFLSGVSGTGVNLSNDVRINNNSVVVESSVNTGLNSSAEITFYSTPGDNSDMLRNGAACGVFCTNLTALTATNVKFNVTSWTNYSLGDVTAPLLSLVVPSEGEEFNTNLSIALNFTASDSGKGIDSCWFNIDDGANTTILDCVNTFFNQSDGTYILNLFANDTINNKASDSNSFTISITAPAITLNYPANNTFFNSKLNIYLNYTAIDNNGIGTCQVWHDLTGTFSLNESNTGVISGQQNFTLVNVSSDNVYNWNVFCNDTNGDSRFSTNNFTFIVDTTLPAVNITTISTTLGSQTFSFNIGTTDTNLKNCWYSLINSSGGIDGNNENISLNCNANNTQDTVSGFGTFNVSYWANDSAANENSVTKSFTTTQLLVVGGGGGGGSPPVQEAADPLIPVIALPEILGVQVYTNLERAIIYSAINNFISELLSGEPLASADFSEEAFITSQDLAVIQQGLLDRFGLQVAEEDLLSFFQKYKDSELVQEFATLDQIKRFELFTSVLGETTPFKVLPPSVDKFVFFYEPDFSNRTIPFLFSSNKEVASCDIISNTPDLSCEIGNNTLTVSYNVKNTTYFSQVFSGTLLVTTKAEPERVEQKRVQVTFRTYNLGYKIATITISVTAVTLLISFFIIRSKNARRRLKKAFKGE